MEKVAGPVAWTMLLMVIVAIPLVVRVGKASVAEVTKYVAGTLVLTALMCVYSFGINYCLWFQ